jgi:thiamine-phosphate pyrophosphorylase
MGTLGGFPNPPATDSAGPSPARSNAITTPILYIITDRHATGGRPLAAVVTQALEGAADAGAPGGAVAVQLREKDLDGAALLSLARDLRRITAAAGAGLYINDRADVALAVGADGVHLGGASLTPAEVGRIAPGLAVAVSSHGLAELARAVAEPNVRFAVLGPIFDTPSKRGFGPPLGLDVLAAAAKLPLPTLALGGVTLQNAGACLDGGASGVALIRAVLTAEDPRKFACSFFLADFMERWAHKGRDLT